MFGSLALNAKVKLAATVNIKLISSNANAILSDLKLLIQKSLIFCTIVYLVQQSQQEFLDRQTHLLLYSIRLFVQS